jgi:two-component system osmolarity sensor histidine kinase EnvZ
LLALAFMAVEVVALVLFVVLAMLPMARQSADDLAGLMVLSAQTWAELPPDTRPAFEAELRQGHALQVRAAAQGPQTQGPLTQGPVSGSSRWQPPFFQMLASALGQRLHTDVPVTAQADADGATVYWARLPAGSGALAVGVSDDRVNTRPVLALLLALLLGAVVSVALAWWLARRVVEPLARLQRATAEVGQGDLPALLPEEGPLEVVLLSRRFNAMAVQVQALVAARTTLLAGVSHDLRTPLARMRLALELLRVKPTPSLLDRLDQDVTHMNDIIGNVLDLARGLAHEPPVAVDVLALLQGLAQDHSTSACQVQVTCPPCVLPLPRMALHRALDNLLENAMRYAPVCPVELRCEATATGYRLGVLDRGLGIAPHDVEAMFQPFRRMEASRSPATGGRGLGLAIVRELCQANGWQVSLVAREGGGMAAWVELMDGHAAEIIKKGPQTHAR